MRFGASPYEVQMMSVLNAVVDGITPGTYGGEGVGYTTWIDASGVPHRTVLIQGSTVPVTVQQSSPSKGNNTVLLVAATLAAVAVVYVISRKSSHRRSRR
jgi:hypothetical protein